ncbi:hypothetical protein QQF64_011921 [Cirrhinus molitorella]|uniref:Uncharacterized protein n=1 Tax=Cirrhinus molitorella TaxID=172907 RepID=A0ABR3LWI8_9TELE
MLFLHCGFLHPLPLEHMCCAPLHPDSASVLQTLEVSILQHPHTRCAFFCIGHRLREKEREGDREGETEDTAQRQPETRVLRQSEREL